MVLKTILAAGACKIARRVLHLTGRGGTTVPGRIAMAIDRDVLTASARGMHIVLVTGTNGKTTTSRMIEKGLSLAGEACLLNRSGANLLPGITAEMACNLSRMGKPRADWAVVECDEGALHLVTARIKPDVIIVTNLFRDQLDRYGEVMHTREEIREGIRLSPESLLCLNADCPLTATAAEGLSNPVLYYGLDVPAGEQGERELSDARYCMSCGGELVYDAYTYAHLGAWRCPSCGRRRPRPDVAVIELPESQGSRASHVTMRLGEQEHKARVGLPAIYNLYNALAAVCVGKALGMPEKPFLDAVASAEAAFGRMESFTVGKCEIQVILVKNPAGCSQAMAYIAGTDRAYGVAFCLNDKIADGTDISWIWDADTEKIVCDPKRRSLWAAGTRAEDMQLRLKYAGAREDEIHLERDYGRLLEDMANKEERVFILPNYTAMLEIRQVLAKKTGGEAFWKG